MSMSIATVIVAKAGRSAGHQAASSREMTSQRVQYLNLADRPVAVLSPCAPPIPLSPCPCWLSRPGAPPGTRGGATASIRRKALHRLLAFVAIMSLAAMCGLSAQQRHEPSLEGVKALFADETAFSELRFSYRSFGFSASTNRIALPRETSYSARWQPPCFTLAEGASGSEPMGLSEAIYGANERAFWSVAGNTLSIVETKAGETSVPWMPPQIGHAYRIIQQLFSLGLPCPRKSVVWNGTHFSAYSFENERIEGELVDGNTPKTFLLLLHFPHQSATGTSKLDYNDSGALRHYPKRITLSMDQNGASVPFVEYLISAVEDAKSTMRKEVFLPETYARTNAARLLFTENGIYESKGTNNIRVRPLDRVPSAAEKALRVVLLGALLALPVVITLFTRRRRHNENKHNTNGKTQ